ncbi:hypothetical protein ACFV4K_04050 [Nocardia sp. NPDC059764]
MRRGAWPGGLLIAAGTGCAAPAVVVAGLAVLGVLVFVGTVSVA